MFHLCFGHQTKKKPHICDVRHFLVSDRQVIYEVNDRCRTQVMSDDICLTVQIFNQRVIQV